ncbi:MAG: hypothetical protein ACI8S6_003427 [Myxococcota bacterium]|jgi:hypothetical protein
MNPLDPLFDGLDHWRHLPAYPIKDFTSIFFSAYLPEVIREFTGVPVSAQMIPELPIKRDLIKQKHRSNQSMKIDYCLFSEDKSRVFFVALKPDMKQRQDAQAHYLENASEIGFKAVLEGIKQIALATKGHHRYAHLLAALAHHGCVQLPEDLMENLYPEATPELRARQKDIKVLAGDREIEVIFIQPETGPGHTIDFETFAAIVDRHDDPVSKRFAESLRKWAVPAASMQPASPADG